RVPSSSRRKLVTAFGGGGRNGWPASRSQSFTVQSSLDEPRGLPSGLKTTSETQLVWPRTTVNSFLLARSHTRIVLSLPEEARRPPTGLKASPDPSPSCPTKRATTFPVVASRKINGAS